MHDNKTQSNTNTTTTTTTNQVTTAATSTSTEASKMLEAALQQMDGIISGATSSGNVGNNSVSPQQSSVTAAAISGDDRQQKEQQQQQLQHTISLSMNERKLISASNVLATAKTLALALQQVGGSAPSPDALTAAIISDWLETHIPRQDTDERLRRLQRDKEALALQYQALADRTSQQADRIIELESLLTEKTQQLSIKDELLQRQVLSRSALETQKLELMTALSELKLHRAALERENVELAKGMINENATNNKNVDSTLHHQQQQQKQHMLENGGFNLVDRQRVGSLGNLNNAHGTAFGPPKTPPSSLRHQIHSQFHSLPRSVKNNTNNNNNKSYNNNNNINSNRAFDANANSTVGKQRNVAFASNEKILIDDNGGGGGDCGDMNASMYGSFMSQTNSSPSPNLRERSAKGLRTIFGKLRRSNSGNLELPALEQAEPEFKRGGVGRATAGGRIEWTTQSSQLSTSSKGYTDWSPQEVCNWLCDLGLGCYEEDCRKWLKSNPSICFFTVSPVDIEKELNLKSPLHRKKILLASDELTGKEDDILALKAAQLDITWVMRWLDDIGLPQYKDTFLQAKMDGRMLHRLTMEDLAYLHISSCLHIASLRRGIQVMREMNWNPECLIRRSIAVNTASAATTITRADVNTNADDNDDGDGESNSAKESINSETNECIALWTAHRVMEWLRVADLSEYAPNLRGAGVHGALMLYETRFNADLLADLLSIPPSKTLLRRHLATHFKELLGRDTIQMKRDAEAASNYQPLTITAKLKPPKKTQFSLKRRKSTKGPNDIEWTDYVCPMATAATVASATPSTSASTSTTSENVIVTTNNKNSVSATPTSSTNTNESNAVN